MMLQSENELIELALDWVRTHGLMNGKAVLTSDTDLLDAGLLDSVGFVDLVLFIEAQSGCKIDLTDIDPAVLSVVGTLCSFAFNALRQAQGAELAFSQATIQACPDDEVCEANTLASKAD
jgi:acyl carrier protein